MDAHALYHGVLNYIWIAYALNLGLILYLFSQSGVKIKNLLDKSKLREKISVLVLFLVILSIGSIFIQNNHYAVVSDAWYDTYAGKEISELNFNYLGYYKYGHTYPYTIALLFLFSKDVSVISYFSLLCFLVSLALISLSLYTLTGKKAIAYLSLGITASMYVVLRHAFIYQGKEIFIFLVLSSFLFSLSLLYKKYDFKTLMLSVLILLFAVSLKYEMINLVYLIPLVLFLSKTKIQDIKKDMIKREHILILILVIFVFSFTAIGFFRYSMRDIGTGAYAGAYVRYGSGAQAFITYLTENSLEILRLLTPNIILIFPISLLGLGLHFLKYKKQIVLILLFGFFCILPYLVYFPYLIEERYVISFIIMFICLSSMGIGLLFNFKKRKKLSLLLATLIFILLIGRTYYSVNSLYPIINQEFYMYQDAKFHNDVISKIPPDQNSLIITTHWNTRFLLKTISDNNLYEILSFDHSDGVVASNVYQMFHYNNCTDVNSTYPFIFDMDRPTYFMYDLYCEQTWFEVLPFLCDALMNKRFNSRLVYENQIFKLYRIEEK